MAGVALIIVLGIGLVFRHGIHYRLVHAWHRLHPIRPNIAWQTATPAKEGMSAKRLQRLSSDLARRHTKAFIVVRNNRIVWEWYAPGMNPNYRLGTAAMAKAGTASIVMAAALSDGYLNLTNPAAKYIPAWRNDPVRSKILIADLASHDSGMADVNFIAAHAGKVSGWKQEYYDEPSNRFSFAIHSVPILFPPGTKVRYSGIGYYALAYAVTVALQQAPEKDIKDFLREAIMRPVGVPDSDWQLSYGQSYRVDGMTLYAFSSGASYSARALARMGQLVLDQGTWNGKEIFTPASFKQLLASCRAPAPGSSPVLDDRAIPGGGWWLNTDSLLPALPRDALIGFGNNDECLLVVPSLNLVAVRLGHHLDPSRPDGLQIAYNLFFAPVVEAVNQAAPADKPKSGVALNR